MGKRTSRSLAKEQPARQPGTAGGLQALQQALQQALALYSSREWDKAEQVCRMILAARPAHFDALNLLGIIAAQTRRPQEAADFLGRAVALRRDDATAHNNYGNVLRELARYDDALRSYNRAIQLKPNYAEAHYNRGVTLHELKRFEDSLASYDRALKVKPDYAGAYNNRGVTLRELKRFDEALASYDRALALKPDYAAAHNNRGIALQGLKRPQDALESYARALTLHADYAEALHNQGNALKDLDRIDEALASFEQALRINPEYAEAYNSRGSALQLLARHEDALESYDRALAIDPRYFEAHCNRGHALRELQLPEAALESYERGLALKPDCAEVHNICGTILHELKRFEAGLQSFERALELEPASPWLCGIRLHARMRLCQWGALDSELAAMVARIGQGEPASTPFCGVTLTDSPALQRRVAEIWTRETVPTEPKLPPLPRRARGARLRIGYFSADYYYHATAALAAGLFELHDREQFEIVAFAFGPQRRDDMTDRLVAAFDQFIDVRARTDVQVAQLARDLHVDIAVDLKGYTQHQRAGIFAQRAAPVQVNYLGYPGTMGTSFIDYIIADEILIPAAARGHYAEKVVYLPGSYQVNDRKRVIADRQWSRAELGLPPDGFVFGCFNNAYKIMPPTFDCWMRILRRVERSVLWLLEEDPAASNSLRREAQRAGVDPARLVFAPPLPLPEHLARHRLAGLFLDTLPCNAHTTASDSLWAGLPVLTCAGESFPARVAASLLNAVGLPELVSTTLAQYEEMAVELAMNPGRLGEIAARLSGNRLTAPLFDTELFTRRLEEAYRQMFQRHAAGLPADHIHIAG